MDSKSGFLKIIKPPGISSHGVVDRLRRITGVKKIGHAGTLDPFAGGLLLVAVGREATREIGRLVKLDKTYWATLRLGATSDTFDPTGDIRMSNAECRISNSRITEVLGQFVGRQKQVPPMYSAKKVGGRKLYELARQGIEIEREPAEIEIYALELTDYAWPRLEIEVQCSSGTYIRSLAHDIGQALGCGAYLEKLERTRIGEFDLRDAQKLEELSEEKWTDFLFRV